MCGITGIANIKNHKELVRISLEFMKNRGNDNSHIISFGDISIGHNLHSIVGFVKQPFESEEFIFAINCEIYNWEELNDKYDLSSENDAETLFKIINKKGTAYLPKILDELDGVFAFSLFNKKTNSIYLARDLIGVKPLFYTTHFKEELDGVFAFSSEKKTLEKQNFKIIKELNPRQILNFNLSSRELEFTQREYLTYDPEHTSSKIEIEDKVEELLTKAIIKRVPKGKNFGILFSGGIDSTIIAWICKKHKIPFTCYTAAVEGYGNDAPDLVMAKKIAKELDFPLKIATINIDNLEPYIKKVCELIESNNVTKVGVALPFYIASELAAKDNIKVIFSGLGSEEIFAGYERHATSAGIGKQGYDKLDEYDSMDIGNVNKECLSGLMQIHERDLYRDDVVTMYNQIELRLPFLDKDLANYSLKIPPKYKISKIEKKLILRVVSEKLGLPKEYAWRPKKAAQYGSKFDKTMGKLAKKKGFPRKSEYLKQFYSVPNLKLGSLLSTGKDSLYAACVMQQRNYEITCFLTIESENKDSYLFHTPGIELAKIQSKAAEIPILVQKTKGEKELELDDLRDLLLKAKNKFHIEGVVSGALFSTYQRDRFEKVCDELGLICWNPLWHKNQEDYMYELIQNKVDFVFSKVMAEGLDKYWINKIITRDDVDKLVAMNKKVGINIAGEGGEFETLTLDCPLFKKKLNIDKFDLIYDPERKETVTLDIIKVSLVDKV